MTTAATANTQITLTPEQLEAARILIEEEGNKSSRLTEQENIPSLVHGISPATTPNATTDQTQEDAEVKQEEAASSGDTDVNISKKEFELLQQLKKEQRKWQIEQQVKELGKEFHPRRNTLILRRALKLCPDIVSSEDVIAYSVIYKMRDAVTAKDKKILVSDEEIQAYHKLEELGLPITLEAIMKAVKS